jgi:hypothetical protein
MMNNQSNRREFTRVATTLTGKLSAGEISATVSGQTTDISLGGLFLTCDASLPIGTECKLVLFFGEPNNQIRIEAEGRIARVDSEGVGVELTVVELGSFEHLRNLVLYNTSEPQQAEEEFRSHLGIKRRTQ